ncbi:MAG: LysR family transcriptional regulator [Pseudomonadota bacterium]
MQRVNPQTLRRLTYFAAIADAGSIREAARRLGLSVASVSEALAALEDELGSTLAVRNTRRLQLTEEGRRVERIAAQVVDAGASLFSKVSEPSALTGYAALTVPVEIAHSWLPRQLERFKRKYPKVGLSLSASDHLVDLSQSTFDVAIRARYIPPGGALGGKHELPLICASAEPLILEQRDDGWYVDTTLLSHRKHNYLDVILAGDETLRRLTFAEVLHVDNKHVAMAMAAKNMGASLVLKRSLATVHGVSDHLSDFDFGHLGLDIEMRDKRPSPAAIALREVLVSD